MQIIVNNFYLRGSGSVVKIIRRAGTLFEDEHGYSYNNDGSAIYLNVSLDIPDNRFDLIKDVTTDIERIRNE